MVNKKNNIYIVFLLIAITLISTYTACRIVNCNPYKNQDDSDIIKINFTYVNKHIHVTEKEDIAKIMNLLKSMELHRSIEIGSKSGIVVELDIYEKNNVTPISILSNSARIGNSYYHCQDYCDQFYKLFDEIAEKYDILN